MALLPPPPDPKFTANGTITPPPITSTYTPYLIFVKARNRCIRYLKFILMVYIDSKHENKHESVAHWFLFE